MSVKQFRILIMVYIVLALLSGFLDTIFPSLIPAGISQAEDAYYDTIPIQLLTGIGVFCIVVIIANIIAIIGLFLFKYWAPRLAVVVTVVSLLIIPMTGIDILSAWTTLVNESSFILWGIILTVVHFSPLREQFTKKPAKEKTGL